MQAVYGTNLNAFRASRTNGVVNDGKVILNRDRTVRTCLLALHASNTSVGAVLASYRSLVVIGALNNDLGGVIDKLDDMIGAFSDANAATDAFLRVDPRNAVLDRNSVLRTDSDAITVAVAGVGARLVTVVQKLVGNAGLGAVVVELLDNGIAVAVAGNVGNLFHNVLCLYTEDLCNLTRDTVTARNTEVGCFGFLIGKSFCVSVTTAISACTAVGTGQAIADCGSLCILFYAKKGCGKCEQYSAEKAHAEQNKYGN